MLWAFNITSTFSFSEMDVRFLSSRSTSWRSCWTNKAHIFILYKPKLFFPINFSKLNLVVPIEHSSDTTCCDEPTVLRQIYLQEQSFLANFVNNSKVNQSKQIVEIRKKRDNVVWIFGSTSMAATNLELLLLKINIVLYEIYTSFQITQSLLNNNIEDSLCWKLSQISLVLKVARMKKCTWGFSHFFPFPIYTTIL